MKFNIIDKKRTNNFTDPNIETKIISLWEENEILVNQSLAAGKSIVCVYHEYDSNYKGDYSVSLGVEEYLEGEFDCSSYSWKEYKVNSSEEFGVLNTWKKIWEDEEKGKIDRVYDFDFEKYSPDGQIAIHISCK